MPDIKDTARALVRIGFDGRVHKTFRGHQALERFQNEVRVLRWLEEKGCPNVPRILETDPESLRLVTTSCGSRVEHLSRVRLDELYGDLQRMYSVRHDDAYLRNVTYDAMAGRFCLIDFEFATILDPSAPPGPVLDPPMPDLGLPP
jgi:tRNA A-37 threonylcarbamoyl transferase component Bud32